VRKDYKEGEAPIENYDIGVLVGRFQTPKLHTEHKKLFDYVCARHEKVICYLGLAPIQGDTSNPLDFNQRRAMIQEDFPNVQCFYIKDVKNDEVWSKNLDTQISDMLMPMQKPLLYGSRDSFISGYRKGAGKFDTEELESHSIVSGTQIRKETSRTTVANYFVRLGMVLASNMKYPTSFTTVDIAIMDNHRKDIWLGRKDGEEEFRFIGGFTDPNSETIEDDAKREVLEETHIVISEPTYICSMKIDDWRYRTSRDKIKTTLWIGDRIAGDPKPDDDIAEIKRFAISDFIYETGYAPFGQPYKVDNLVDEHKRLMVKLLDYLIKG
jgi:bifunctional NMN adenylyltransferase/nudix hydrolase